MTDRAQTEAGSTHIIRYALELGLLWIDGDGRDKVREALDALDALEAQLASIGASPTPPVKQQAASSAVLKAIREANMQLVRTGDDALMLVPYKVATAEQAAPKAAPEVGNSGFDYKTAADFLNGKTVSDEAVRKFVAASRWAHDERAALSATLLAMHGVLTSREAEIALLKKALLEAEAAPQQEAQEPVAWLSPWRADQVTTDYDAYGERGIPLYTAPQPAPAPLSDDVVKDAARYRYLRDVPMSEWPYKLATAFQLQQNAIWDATIDEALGAQRGKV